MHIILFDIDGTLVASGGAGKAAMEAALVEDFGVRGPLVKVPYSGRTDRAISRDLLGLHGVEPSEANWHRLRDGYLRRLPAALHHHQGTILPGIAALLGQLSSRANVVLGLLTGNVRAGARLKLGHFGLFEHFTLGGFGDFHFERDDVAREALEAVRGHVAGSIDLGRVWVVGDTPLDVSCARAIGAQVAAVATGWHPIDELAGSKPDLLFENLADPAPLLKRMGL